MLLVTSSIFTEAFLDSWDKIVNHLPLLFTVPGIIGCLQALEAIKIASAVGEPLSGRMLLLDALSARIRIVRFSFHIVEIFLGFYI